MTNHNHFMLQAVNLAKKARLKNLHNILVGCVIVKNNKIIASGYYDKTVSKNHAEIIAIDNAKEDIKDSIVYVTLEPCSHWGNTSPCVDALISKKVKEVVIPFKDPNPLVNGVGIKRLKNAGINVVTNVLAEECYNLNEEFLYYHIKKLPLVTAKWASSLDGKLSTYNYSSKWISSESARKQAHKLRQQNSAILIGSNTLNNDNPLLNIRYNIKTYKPFIRIILANNNTINPDSALWKDNTAINWLIIPNTIENNDIVQDIANKNVSIISLPVDSDGYINFKDILKELALRKVSSLIVEGGAFTLSKLFEKRLVNKIELFMGSIILGGNINVANFINSDFDAVKKGEHFKITQYKQLEDTIWISLINKSLVFDRKNNINLLNNI